MKIAIYCRVSTGDQSCEVQRKELTEYCAARKWAVYSEYADTGWSGAKAVRPELTRLMKDATQRKFDAVIVWKLDRWGRNVTDCIRSIQELDLLGVRFIAVTQNIDTDEKNPMGRFLLHIMSAFAELERELIRERTIAGVRAARAKGKVLGRPRKSFMREEVAKLRSQGMTWRGIADIVGVSASILHREMAG